MQVYILAETGNKGKAVDVIGAAHANADAVIQFGDASLVPVAGVLVHHILPKNTLKTDSLIAEIKQLLNCLSKDVLVVLLDGPFMHVRGSLLDALKVRSRPNTPHRRVRQTREWFRAMCSLFVHGEGPVFKFGLFAQGLPVHVTESPYELTRAEHNSLLDNLVSCVPKSKDCSNGALCARILIRLFH